MPFTPFKKGQNKVVKGKPAGTDTSGKPGQKTQTNKPMSKPMKKAPKGK